MTPEQEAYYEALVAEAQGEVTRTPEPVWIICTVKGQQRPRHMKCGHAEPHLRPDEFAFRVMLPPAQVRPRGIIRLALESEAKLAKRSG